MEQVVSKPDVMKKDPIVTCWTVLFFSNDDGWSYELRLMMEMACEGPFVDNEQERNWSATIS